MWTEPADLLADHRMMAAVQCGDGTQGRRRLIADAYRAACALELAALKPGNVHRASAGHGMRVDDFLRSAKVSAGPLSEPGLGLGERVWRAVAATRAAVACNTNLGILLLAAPLVQAALEPTRYGGLREGLTAVLQSADRRDTHWLFQAIRLAAPGGLGTADRHDVTGAATATPLEVMAQAAERDRIAYHYTTGFGDLFERAVPLLAALQARWQDPVWATAGLYMDFLGRGPDTHIARKRGLDQALAVARQAAPIAAALCAAPRPEPYRAALAGLDRQLKAAGINPGTCADLTVACLLIRGLQPLYPDALSAAEARRILSTGPLTPAPVPFVCETCKSEERERWQSSIRSWSASHWSATATRSPTST